MAERSTAKDVIAVFDIVEFWHVLLTNHRVAW